MVFGAFIFWLISALGAFWVVNTMAMRSRLRKRGEAATAEVVNVAGTQLYDATRTCTIRYVRANGEETFARLVSSRSRGLAKEPGYRSSTCPTGRRSWRTPGPSPRQSSRPSSR